ncbi:MAG: hypothetical protein JW751_19335 [Polyangiaceae bacterium]|nr:hypothetical protein [Polyangiaceae bacterium]
MPREAIEPLEVASPDRMTFLVSGSVSGLGVEPPHPPPRSKATLTVLMMDPEP